MPSGKIQLWDRQADKGEGPDAYKLFWIFLELGTKRRLELVAEEAGRTLGLVGKLSAQYKWLARARAFDKHLLDIQLKVIESTTKADAVLFAKREAAYRHEAYDLSVKILAKANEMLEAPLYRTEIDTVTEVIGQDGQKIQVPTKIIQTPVRWNFKTIIDFAEVGDKLRRLSLGVPTSHVAVDNNWIQDPAQRLVQAKAMMVNWIKTKLENAVIRVCNEDPTADPAEVRAKLLTELPLWFAEHYNIEDASALIDALPEMPPAPTPLLLDEGDKEFDNN